jgi:perosamine synthetase
VAEAAALAGKQLKSVATEAVGFNMSVPALRTALSELPHGSAVVIATHQYGIPCDIHGTLAAAREFGALVLEDAAGALGSVVAGQPAGSWGDAAIFSFDSTKLIHTPLKAGAVVTRDANLLARIRELHETQTRPAGFLAKAKLLALASALLAIENPWLYRAFHWWTFGRTGRFMMDVPGCSPIRDERFAGRCTEWQARLVAGQLAELARHVQSRQGQFSEYRRRLASCRRIELPPADEGRNWCCVRFPVLVRGDKSAYYRDCLRHGVDLAFSFTYLADETADPRAAEIARRVVNLPFYGKLRPAELERVAAALRAVDGDGGGGDVEDARAGQHGAEPAAAEGALLVGGVLERQG